MVLGGPLAGFDEEDAPQREVSCTKFTWGPRVRPITVCLATYLLLSTVYVRSVLVSGQMLSIYGCTNHGNCAEKGSRTSHLRPLSALKQGVLLPSDGVFSDDLGQRNVATTETFFLPSSIALVEIS